jgi:hypothetical protein
MEDKKVLKAEELSEDELDQAAGGFTVDTVNKGLKMQKVFVEKSEKDATKSVKALTDNKAIVKNFTEDKIAKD